MSTITEEHTKAHVHTEAHINKAKQKKNVHAKHAHTFNKSPGDDDDDTSFIPHDVVAVTPDFLIPPALVNAS